MAALLGGMRMPSAISNIFEDIRDAAKKGAAVGAVDVSFQMMDKPVERFTYPEKDKENRADADLSAELAKKLDSIGSITSLSIESLTPFDVRLKQLPAWLSQATSLTELRLTRHRINKLVPDEIYRSLTALHTLSLAGCALDVLPESPGDFALLTDLNLSDNNLFALPNSLTLLTSLQKLNISRNPIDKWLVANNMIQSLPNLKSLSIAGIPSLTEPLPHLTSLAKLTSLDVSSNKIWKIQTEFNLKQLQVLNLSDNQLKELAPESLPLSLTSLDISKNKFSTFPSAVLALTQLRTLRLSSNAIAELPDDIDCFSVLQELNVSHNALEKLPSTIGSIADLRVLGIAGNTCKSLPSTIGHCRELRSLNADGNLKLKLLPRSFDSLANLSELVVAGIRVESNPSTGAISAESVDNHSPNDLRKQLVQLVHLARTSQHPLVVFALASKATDEAVADFVVEEGALEDLVSFCSEVSPVEDLTSEKSSDGSQSARSSSSSPRLSATDHLREISLEALKRLSESDTIRKKLIHHEKELAPMLSSLLRTPHRSVASHVASALYIIGNLALNATIRKTLETFGVIEKLGTCLQSQHSEIVDQARRALSAFGENSLTSKPVKKRGVRILALDGGGTRGVATVAMLHEIEKMTGKRLHEMFDLIAGVSTGSIIAMLTCVKKMPTPEIAAFYRDMAGKIFSNPRNGSTSESASANYMLTQAYSSWAKVLSFSSILKQGTLYQTKIYEDLIQAVCGKDQRIIDTASVTDTKLIIVSSLISRFPPETYLIRNYNYPSGVESAYMGSSEMKLWQTIRASSAAPVFFDDFVLGEDKFVDGGFCANNPTGIALSEAKTLWPDREIDLVLSVGTGRRNSAQVEKTGTPSLINLAMALVESATDPEKIHHALKCVLPSAKYMRLQPVHQVYECELDETRPAKFDEMESVAVEYFNSCGIANQLANILSQE